MMLQISQSPERAARWKQLAREARMTLSAWVDMHVSKSLGVEPEARRSGRVAKVSEDDILGTLHMPASEAAAELGVDVRTVQRWRQKLSN